MAIETEGAVTNWLTGIMLICGKKWPSSFSLLLLLLLKISSLASAPLEALSALCVQKQLFSHQIVVAFFLMLKLGKLSSRKKEPLWTLIQHCQLATIMADCVSVYSNDDDTVMQTATVRAMFRTWGSRQQKLANQRAIGLPTKKLPFCAFVTRE